MSPKTELQTELPIKDEVKQLLRRFLGVIKKRSRKERRDVIPHLSTDEYRAIYAVIQIYNVCVDEQAVEQDADRPRISFATMPKATLRKALDLTREKRHA